MLRKDGPNSRTGLTGVQLCVLWRDGPGGPRKARQYQGWDDASVIPRKQPKGGKLFTMQTISADRPSRIFQTQIGIATNTDSTVSHVDHVTLKNVMNAKDGADVAANLCGVTAQTLRPPEITGRPRKRGPLPFSARTRDTHMHINNIWTAPNSEIKELFLCNNLVCSPNDYLGIDQFSAAVDSHFRASPAQLHRRRV